MYAHAACRLFNSISRRDSRRYAGMSMRFLCPCRLCCNRYRGRWIHELPLVILGLHTRPSKATGQTPFFLVYGSEAILSADITWKSPRLEMYDEIEADGSRQLELDTVEEVRCNALPSKKKSTSPYHWTTSFGWDYAGHFNHFVS